MKQFSPAGAEHYNVVLQSNGKDKRTNGEQWSRLRYTTLWIIHIIILLTTKHRLLYLKTQSIPRSKHFSSRL